jgi:hypothetical protein
MVGFALLAHTLLPGEQPPVPRRRVIGYSVRLLAILALLGLLLWLRGTPW